MTDERFPKKFRVRTRIEFERVHRQKTHAADRCLVVRGCHNNLAHTRLGLAVSRRVGNAVVRNRWKRMIREAFRRTRHQLPTGIDLVVRPRKGADCRYADVVASLPKLARQLERRLSSGQ